MQAKVEVRDELVRAPAQPQPLEQPWERPDGRVDWFDIGLRVFVWLVMLTMFVVVAWLSVAGAGSR